MDTNIQIMNVTVYYVQKTNVRTVKVSKINYLSVVRF